MATWTTLSGVKRCGRNALRKGQRLRPRGRDRGTLWLHGRQERVAQDDVAARSALTMERQGNLHDSAAAAEVG